MRTCVIFNPVAKGQKAARFRRHLNQIAAHCSLKMTTAAGEARRLAAEAVGEGFEAVVAAGGDGTVNEVLNGIGDARDGFARVRLGVLPLGTVNVFARELSLPTKFEKAWRVIREGHETVIDLPRANYEAQGAGRRLYFAQLAGAGLDARAIELVNWPLKKKIGPLAYVWAGLQALREPPARITVSGNGEPVTGALVLIGNGQLYGGSYRIFPEADLRDGLLDVAVFPRVNWLTLARCGPQLLLQGSVPWSAARHFSAATIRLSAEGRVSFEADGELVGQLPAEFTVEKSRLRVLVPPPGAGQNSPPRG